MNNENKIMINTNLFRKESEFRTKSCVVEKAIAVSHGELSYSPRPVCADRKGIHGL